MRRVASFLLAAFALAGLAAGLAVADEDADRSWLIRWVENTISTPDRQIRLGHIDGALSSDVRLASITIADRKGVWLTIRDVHLVWTRSDLLQGRLTVDRLEAAAIDITRKPENAPDAADDDGNDQPAGGDAAAGFSLPELPVAVDIGGIRVPTVRLPAEIAGRPTVLAIDGRGRLADGDLNVDLAATRETPVGGAFTAKVNFAGATRRLALDLSLAEPPGGFLTTLLGLPGEPAIELTVRGTGPVDDFGADITLAADGKRLLAGRATTRLDGNDRTYTANVGGSLEALFGPGGGLTSGAAELRVLAHHLADGSVRLDEAHLRTGVASFDAAGAYRPLDTGVSLALDRLAAGWDGILLDLASPTTVVVANGRIAVPPSTLRLADTKASGGTSLGTIAVSGSLGRDLALDVTARRLPVAAARIIVADLGPDGVISADLTIRGTRRHPAVTWRLDGEGLSLAATKMARLPAAALTANGTLDRNVTSVDASIRLGRDATLMAQGRVPLDGEGLALNVTARQLPLSLADGFVPELGGRGVLSGTATVTGSLKAPAADWKLTGDSLSLAATRDAGLSALRLAATGRLDRTATTLSATLAGGDRLRLTAEGRVPFTGDGLAAKVTGEAALALADIALRERGTRLTGRARVDATAAGSLAKPRLSGTVTVADGTLLDPETTMRLSGIAALVRLDTDRVTLERFQATTGQSGRITARGTVGVAAELPADLAIAFEAAKLSLGEMARSEVNGTLRLTGPLAGTPTLSGRLTLGRTEITIPERFAANAASLGVKDLAVPPEVRRTLALARPKGTRRGGGGPRLVRLDLTIDAPSQLFVRGRGLNAELGGTLRVAGTSEAVVPVGAFELRRGALDVIGRHISLDRGRVTLDGNLNPYIDFRASSTGRTVAVVAEVTGRADDPALVLTSTPELPQDEVLAQFLFGRGVADLSSFQLVQLATAAGQLAGGSSAPDLLAQIRKSTGLDTLSAVTDAKGNAGVQAGRYISERIYLGVTAGADGSTDATVDLDITRELKLRAQAGDNGSKAGVIFEREY